MQTRQPTAPDPAPRYHGYNFTGMPGRRQAATRGDLKVEHVRGTSPDGGVASAKSSYAVMPCTLAVRRGIDVRHPVDTAHVEAGAPLRFTEPEEVGRRFGKPHRGRRREVVVGSLQRLDGTPMRDGVVESDARTRAADGSVRGHAAQHGRSRSDLRGAHVPQDCQKAHRFGL